MVEEAKIEIHFEFQKCFWGKYFEIFWIYIHLAWKVIYENILELLHLYMKMKSKENILEEKIYTQQVVL